jgi:MFS family permease
VTIAQSPTTARRALGANYHRLFAASVISNLGDGVAQIAYPWLASAVTRDPLLVAVVAVAQRLPWLLFTLPAGVITDRVDRQRLIIRMDLLRGLLTAGVAAAVLVYGSDLPSPSEVEDVTGTRTGMYLVIVLASLLLGCAEVLRDNSAQTILPAIVRPEQLERANGRMWSAELVANTFVGPPLGSLLIAGAFFVPFVVDAASFFCSAALVALLVGHFRARPSGEPPASDRRWTDELREGLRWLWHHSLLRTLAITLGVLNAIGMMQFATLVLFAQEVLGASPTEFAVLTMGGAVGGVVGGLVAPAITERLGGGPALWLTLVATALTPIPIAFTSRWPVVFVMFAAGTLVGTVWNVITVSLRQTIIPDHLLGRVNSVYRFFGWGMMPLGTALGGIIVAVVEPAAGREAALRAPWLASAAIGLVLMVYAIPRLTTEKLDAARAAAAAQSEV